MNGWIVWCALAGAILGIKWPVQAVVLAVSAVVVVGFGYGLRWGFGTGLAAGFGGAVVVQIGYLISILATSLISARANASPLLQRASYRR